MMRRRIRGVIPALVCALAVACFTACNPGTDISEHPCPPEGTEHTYENFGEAFFATYCVECHGGPNGYSSRAFVTVQSIRDQRDRVFLNSAADNTYMPPGPDGPSEAERNMLADWLACGAP